MIISLTLSKILTGGAFSKCGRLWKRLVGQAGRKWALKHRLKMRLQQMVNAGKDSGAVVGNDGKTIGKISMVNAIAAMARPDRTDEGPRYK